MSTMRKNRAFFLDRDGVIIRNIPYLKDESQVELLNGVGEAINKIKQTGFKCIVITNQSGVARGLVSIEDVQRVNDRIRSTLVQKGDILDAFYFCPHHPDGSVKEFAVDCECRKPNPGLLLRAAEDYNLELSESVMIGDEEKDLQAGKKAGCKSFIVGKPMLLDGTSVTFSNLYEVVDYIIGKNHLMQLFN